MTIQDMTCFLKLSETLSYTKTATALYISQPAVSRHINSLEQELGYLLFDRSVRRSIRLTEAGKILADGLKQCSEIYEQTIHRIEAYASQAVLQINLIRNTEFPTSFITATKQYMNEHPEFRHFVNFIQCEDFERVLENGELIICAREFLPAGKRYEAVKLTKKPVPFYLVAMKEHEAFDNPDCVDWKMLADSALFLPKNLPFSLREEIKTTAQAFLESPLREILYVDSAESVSMFLRSGQCYTICPGWQTDVTNFRNISMELPMSTDYYAIWYPEKLQASCTKGYLQVLIDSE